VAIDSQGRTVVAVTSRGELVVWDIASGEVTVTLADETVVLMSVAISAEEARIVAGGNDGTLRFWAAERSEQLVSIDTAAQRIPFVSFSLDGERLVAGTPESVVLLETGPPPGGFASRALAHEARRLVNELYAELEFAEDVEAHLLAHRDLPADIRGEALDLVRLRGDHIGWLNSDAILGYRVTDLAPEEQQRILRKIELVNRLLPDHPEYVASLAKCQYRAGRFREALGNLDRAGRLYLEAGEERPFDDLAFVAMAHWKLGDRAAARAMMQRLESLEESFDQEIEVWNHVIYDEARALTGRGVGG
jgi:tetratricopeptide (TPR) repeat protein